VAVSTHKTKKNPGLRTGREELDDLAGQDFNPLDQKMGCDTNTDGKRGDIDTRLPVGGTWT